MAAIGVVHTFASDCHCHRSLVAALRRLGHEPFELDSDRVPRMRSLPRLDAAFDHTDVYRGSGRDRHRVRLALERRGIPVIGPPAAAVRACDDKPRAKAAFGRLGVPTPAGRALHAVPRMPLDLPYPRVLKPGHEQCSRHLALVRRPVGFAARLRALLATGQPAIVEEFIRGREFGLAVLERNGKPWCLPPVEVRLGSPDAVQYQGSEARFTVPRLPAAVRRAMQRHARTLWEAFGLRGYARLDVRLRDNVPYVLEVNAIPSLIFKDLVCTAAEAAGISYDMLVAFLLRERLRAT